MPAELSRGLARSPVLGSTRSAYLVAGLVLVLLQTAARLSCVLAAPASTREDKIVYWNATNPLFQPTGENVLTVSLQDRINFVCPSNGREYYQIYWTASSEQSRLCSGGTALFNCRLMDSYLVYVQIFPADPTAPGFLNPVYFYTPSTGDLTGLDQTSGGACQTRNMRITVRTDSATSRPVTTAIDTARLVSQSVAGIVTAGTTTRSPASDSGGGGTTAAGGGGSDARAPGTSTSLATSAGDPAGVRTTTGSNGRETERVDFARINLITGAAVATPTVAMVTGLACLATMLAVLW